MESELKKKDNQIDELNKKLEQKEEEKLKEIENKNKQIEQINLKNEKEVKNYTKKIRDLQEQYSIISNKLKEKEKEKESDDGITLSEIVDGEEAEQEEKVDETIKLKEEIKYYEKQIEELKKYESKAKKAEEFEAKNKYLNDNLETMKKNIEEIKNQKLKEENDYKEIIKNLELNIAELKCALGSVEYEFGSKLTSQKRYINKLEQKLKSLGFKFKKPKK